MTPKKPNRSEYLKAKDELRIYLRGCSKHMVDAVHKVIIYAEAEREEIKRLEEELRTLKQTEMFASKPPAPYEPPVKPQWEGASLIDRIIFFVEHNHTEASSWRLMLRLNNLTHEKALAMYEAYKNDKT